MTDTVFIEGLHVDTIIGVYGWEREVSQRLLFDIALSFDCSPAAKTDDVNLALDYSEVASLVTEYVQNNHFQLIETVAENVISLLFEKFNTAKIELTLRKPSAVNTAQAVGIRLLRVR